MNQSSKFGSFLSGLAFTVLGTLALYWLIRRPHIWIPLLSGLVLLHITGVIPSPPPASDDDVCQIVAALVKHHDRDDWNTPLWANQLIIEGNDSKYVVFGGCKNRGQQLVYKLNMNYQSGDPSELSSWKINSLDYKHVSYNDYVDDRYLERIRW